MWLVTLWGKNTGKMYQYEVIATKDASKAEVITAAVHQHALAVRKSRASEPVSTNQVNVRWS